MDYGGGGGNFFRREKRIQTRTSSHASTITCDISSSERSVFGRYIDRYNVMVEESVGNGFEPPAVSGIVIVG